MGTVEQTRQVWDRKTSFLLNYMNFPLQNPIERDRSIRIAVDRETARLFGASPFWNIWPNEGRIIWEKPAIEKSLDFLEIDLSADDFIEERLVIGKPNSEIYRQSTTHPEYYFKKLVDKPGKDVYRLQLTTISYSNFPIMNKPHLSSHAPGNLEE
tara:strand:- start:450 stop:914 length:465 start_codon:yes stop_codon:yes gene_type:complete